METPSENTAQPALIFWAESLPYPYCTGCLYWPDMPKYTRMSKLLAAAHIFTNSCENSKILSQLLSALSLSQKFVYDHCCCPKSAIILTTSKMEAILDFWQGHGKTAPNEKGEKRGGALPWPSNPDNMAAGGATATHIPLSPCLSVRCVSGGGSIKNLHATVQNRKKLNFF